tara:strand:- start:8641 stop:9732 length:1092 start_codon:yes stop_codon:yes gene_type:complete
MIDKLLIILIFILYSINILDIISIKWHNDLFKSNYEQCYILNNMSLYEIETHRYKLNNYIKSKKYNDTIENFKFVFDIIIKLSIILLVLIVLISVYNSEINKIKEIVIIIITIIIITLYYYIGNNIINENKELKKEINNDKSNILYKYDIVYKICNILIYIDENNNIFNEILKYKYTNIINNKRLIDQLESNISKIEDISDETKINFILNESINKLDYLKYINLDELSPYFYKEYFDNMYIIYNNNKIDIKELKNNKKKEINNIIEKKLIDNNIEIEGKGFDYINYFIENKDILFKMVDVDDKTKNTLNNNYNIIILIIIYIIIFILISHYILIKINKNIYILILLLITIIYLLLLWIKLRIL